MKHLLLFFFTLFFLTGYYNVIAKTNPETGNWNNLSLKVKIKNKFSFLGELNFRSEEMISTFNYCEYRGSIVYSLNKNLGFSMGAGAFKKSTEDVFFSNDHSQTEFRTWVDFLQLKHSIGRFNFDHRSRIEQRFLPSNYQNRLRYRLLLNIPLNHSYLTEKTIFLSSYDEVFLGENNPMWERNKFCAAAGYKVNENLTFQMGNILQTEFKKDNTSANKNYLMLTITFNIPGRDHRS